MRFAVSWLLLALAGCAGPTRLEGIGRATDAATTSRATSTALTGMRPPEEPSPIASDFATKLARVGPDSFVSWGHAEGRYAASTYITPTSKDAFETRTGPLPPGTELVMTSTDKTTKQPGPTLFMVKGMEPRGRWTFGVVGANASTNDGLALCTRCHAEAEPDYVFPLAE